MAEDSQKAVSSPAGSLPGAHEIHEHESHRKYKLVTLDNTTFETTVKDLFDGNAIRQNLALWKSNLHAVLERVRKWCDERRDKIVLAFVDFRAMNRIIFYFVPKSDRYDLKLGGEMTDLEVELGGSSGIGSVETLQIPERSLSQFAGAKSFSIWQQDSNSPVA